MLNLLYGYIEDSLPRQGDFITNENLKKKVGPAGEMLPFFGNTCVFLLEEQTKKALSGLGERLYDAAGDMLSHPLQEATYHMTLHDLANGPIRDGMLIAWMEQTKRTALPLMDSFRHLPPLQMRATWLFNMVNTSIVLGLAPENEESFRQLDFMYTALEQARPLGYALTPHITMAYFKPGCYDQGRLSALRAALQPVDLSIVLPMEALCYQEFTGMNDYFTI